MNYTEAENVLSFLKSKHYRPKRQTSTGYFELQLVIQNQWKNLTNEYEYDQFKQQSGKVYIDIMLTNATLHDENPYIMFHIQLSLSPLDWACLGIHMGVFEYCTMNHVWLPE